MDAFRALVERHSRSVYRLASHDGLPADAEDVVQGQILSGPTGSSARFESRSNFGLRCTGIGFNCSIDHFAPPASRVGQGARRPRQAGATGRGPTTEDLVFAGQISDRVQSALNGLSEQERAAFLMRHYHGCSIEEICSALDLRTNAAKHSIFRAVKKMRVALGPFVKMRTV
jgi:RNA polymerase sigma-70 factor (ECF subfamily)